MLGAAAVAVAPTAATALPARVIDRCEPVLDFVPCDGRWLAVRDYLDLFRVMHVMPSDNPVAFRVPDFRARVVAPTNTLPVDVVIVARPGLGLPVGTITHMARPLTVEQALRSINAEASELNRRHRLHVRGMLHG